MNQDAHHDVRSRAGGRPWLRTVTRVARTHGLLSVGIGIVALSFLLAVWGSSLAPHDPLASTGVYSLPPPTPGELPGLVLGVLTGAHTAPVHWFGTDANGFDVFSRVIAAPRTDVVVAVVATLTAMIAGSVAGLIVGYYQNPVTEAAVRVSDIVQSFPAFILAMMLVSLGGRSVASIILSLAVLYTPIFLRLTRGQAVVERGRLYVDAARALGQREASIAGRHVLPNCIAPSMIQSSVTVGWAILLTAGLSFIGAGVRPPTPEWGLMIATGARGIILGEWWPSVFPGIAISITVFGYAIVGNVLEARVSR